MQDFKVTPKLGEESRTTEFYTDAAGKSWPIYSKIIDMGAGPNAGADSVAYAGAGVVKADGHFKIRYAYYTKAATAPVVMDGAALIGTLTLTNVVLTSTADLTTYTGRCCVEYCKAAD